MSQPTIFPLGQGVFASVKTYKKCVNLYLTRYRVTKKGRIVRAMRVGLSQKQFSQLIRIKDKLCQAYDREMAELDKNQQKETISSQSDNSDQPSKVGRSRRKRDSRGSVCSTALQPLTDSSDVVVQYEPSVCRDTLTANQPCL